MERGKGTFAEVVADYIEEKRATGCHFAKGAKVLRRIVDLQKDTDRGLPCLSAGLLARWIEKTPWENEGNRNQRISVLRGLGVFMTRMGYDAVAVPQRLVQRADYDYTPYIFSERELGLLLDRVDRLCESGISSHSDLVFPLVFRILIGCGTRITETLRIEKKDVDLEGGTLLLLNTKNGKERIIPMAGSLAHRCRVYAAKNQLTRGFSSSEWFFPNGEGTPYNSRSVYGIYRNALRLAGISHGGRGKGPRLHDIRHHAENLIMPSKEAESIRHTA